MIIIGNLPARTDIEEPIEDGDTLYYFNESLARLDPFILSRMWMFDKMKDARFDHIGRLGSKEWRQVLRDANESVGDWYPLSVVVPRHSLAHHRSVDNYQLIEYPCDTIFNANNMLKLEARILSGYYKQYLNEV